MFLEAFPHPVFWMDQHKVYKGCNQIFADLMGFTKTTDIIGLKDKDLPFLPEAITKREQIFDKILNDKIPSGISYDCMKGLDNKTIWAQKRFMPLKNPYGKITGIFGTIVDISEQVDRRKKLDHYLERKRILGNFIEELSNISFLSKEWQKLVERAITTLKDITCSKLAIWFKLDATSLKTSWQFATDQVDIVELFEKRSILSLNNQRGYLDFVSVNALKDVYPDIKSIFYYRIVSNNLLSYDDIILLINPDEERLEETSNVVGFLYHLIHSFYLHKFLTTSGQLKTLFLENTKKKD
jgi:hypothetical protein